MAEDAPNWLTRLAAGELEEVTEVEAAELKLPSGRVVACDPLVFLGADPFQRDVKPGSYPTFVGVIAGETAYAKLQLAKRGKIASWSVARCPGEDDVEGWPGYGVDSGVGCLVDRATVEAFLAAEEAVEEKIAQKVAKDGIEPTDPIRYHEAFETYRAEMGDDPLADVEPQLADAPFADVIIEPKKKGNLIAFRSGSGDGVYASFWGLDKAGKPLCLVTDFGVLEPTDDGDESLDDLDLGELDELSREMEGEIERAMGGGGGGGPKLSGLEALAAALGGGKPPEPEEPESRQGPSPLFIQTRDLVKKWVKEEKIELEEGANLDVFAEALLEKLVSLQGHRNPGAHVGEWLLERNEVADVFASDDELEADLRG
ncbi:MAG: DUF4241 domain-containing protein [Sandaracinaceae bacterium]